MNTPNQKGKVAEIAKVFLKLGTIAFGGPAAHIAMMKEELVEKRKWITRETFLDLVGATNLIPGPNSTELAIHLGYQRAGWVGLIVAGSCFILPAMLIVMLFSYIYVAFGKIPEVASILYGIKPVIMAVVLQALWGLSKTAVKNKSLAVIGIAAIGFIFLGGNEILLLVVAGLVTMAIANRDKLRNTQASLISPSIPLAFLSSSAGWNSLTASSTLGKLFVSLLKIGSVLYGSGYVLLAFLQAEFVDSWQVITKQQLLDAVAIGQFTPGPVFTTATFVGYLIAGVPGAIVSTVAIFLPAFLFVAISHPWIPKLRQSTWTGAFLDGVNVASLALMFVVTLQLGVAAVVDVSTACVAILTFVALVRFKMNSAWLVLAGGCIGYGSQLL